VKYVCTNSLMKYGVDKDKCSTGDIYCWKHSLIVRIAVWSYLHMEIHLWFLICNQSLKKYTRTTLLKEVGSSLNSPISHSVYDISLTLVNTNGLVLNYNSYFTALK
jgi:hypothetical protein